MANKTITVKCVLGEDALKLISHYMRCGDRVAVRTVRAKQGKLNGYEYVITLPYSCSLTVENIAQTKGIRNIYVSL